MLPRLKSTLSAFQRWEDPAGGVSTREPQGLSTVQDAQAGLEDEPITRPAADASARDEEHRLVQEVFLQPSLTRRQMVLFAEVERHPGAAAICGRMAEVLAQGEGSVCVADADLRSPSLHQRFRAPVTQGLLEVLQNGGSARRATQRVGPNLWLLPAGSRPADPHTVLTPDRLRMLFKDLRDEFDYVLVSGPPFSQRADSMLLSQLSDGVVLVVEAHATRRERARMVTESLAAAQVPVLGVVLNNRTFPIPDALYRRL
jgi:Mrp family chromosome partitioning ATPase